MLAWIVKQMSTGYMCVCLWKIYSITRVHNVSLALTSTFNAKWRCHGLSQLKVSHTVFNYASGKNGILQLHLESCMAALLARLLDLFNAHFPPEKYWQGPRSQDGEGHERGKLYLRLLCHHQNDFRLKMGRNKSHYNAINCDGQRYKTTVSTNHRKAKMEN